VAIQNGNQLNVCNLGDSGFQLYRQTATATYLDCYSKESTHNFNVPYQLSVLPSDEDVEALRMRGKVKECMSLRSVLRKGRENLCQDTPEDADEYTLDLKEGDVIISGTDGIFDNLFNHEILAMIQTSRDLSPLALARRIVEAAQAKVVSSKKV
jgi:protein phosphatase PTC7